MHPMGFLINLEQEANSEKMFAMFIVLFDLYEFFHTYKAIHKVRTQIRKKIQNILNGRYCSTSLSPLVLRTLWMTHNIILNISREGALNQNSFFVKK